MDTISTSSGSITDLVLDSFLERISSLRPELSRIILFGSRARGDERPDSDYDLMLVVKTKIPALESALYDAVLDTLLTSGRLISLKIFTQQEYDRLGKLSTPFMRRVHEEGVLIG